MAAIGMIAALVTLGDSAVARARDAARARVVHYAGRTVHVPAGWPVYRLGPRSTVCVRLDRRAVYLGVPGPNQACPAHVAGGHRAILVSPAPQGRPAQGAVVAVAAQRRTVLARAASGAVYTGLGFDACAAPSQAALSAWTASPYRAVGIYIGGANRSCGQPNLNSTWVYESSQAGWHLIPTYVGLQAPGTSCSSCSTITPAQAATQGASAADDAVAEMQGLGLGSGNPIYFDMEAYTVTARNTQAVLTFLASWTSALHAAGYLSGVYSSGQSGIADLVSQYGTSYAEPDDLWIADWNGAQTTSDQYVPSADWPAHQRIHQYQGGHNATYGGVKINIDSDYLDGSTASGGIAPLSTPQPTLRVHTNWDGSITLTPSWTGTFTVASWQLLGGDTPATLAPLATIANTGAAVLTTHSTLPYYEAEALDANGQPLGTSLPMPLPPHLVIYGHSAYTPAHGLGGVPVGCFTGARCQITATLTAGRTTVASTSPEGLPAGGSGIVFFKLTPAGRAKLAAARGHRLGVTLTTRDASGARARAALTLTQFATAGRAPRKGLTAGSTLRLVGATDFVGGGGVGGVLAGCTGPAPCRASTTISVHGTVVAQTGQEFIGANELGYLFFKLTGAGRRLLAAARGNQLGAHVVVMSNDPGSGGYAGVGQGIGLPDTATGDIALVSVR
jgi:hypothetical protein